MIQFITKTDATGITRSGQKFYLGMCDKALNLAPNQTYLVLMIPLPHGYRITTDKDRMGPKPEGTKILEDTCTGPWHDALRHTPWENQRVYIVPETPARIKVIVAGNEKMIDLADARRLGLV